MGHCKMCWSITINTNSINVFQRSVFHELGLTKGSTVRGYCGANGFDSYQMGW